MSSVTVTAEGTEFSLRVPKDKVALEGSESFFLRAECSLDLADRCFVSGTTVNIIDADGVYKITCSFIFKFSFSLFW